MSSRGGFCLLLSRGAAPPHPHLSVPSPGPAVAPPGSPRLASPAPRASRDHAPSPAGRPGPCSLCCGASSRSREQRRELGSCPGPAGSGKATAKCFGLACIGAWGRLWGRARLIPGPLRLPDEGKSFGFGLKLRERWVSLRIHT